MSNIKSDKERIGDYAWVSKGRKYWNLWLGNPFYVSCHKVPIDIPYKEVVTEARRLNRMEKKRFKKEFPNINWEIHSIMAFV